MVIARARAGRPAPGARGLEGGPPARGGARRGRAPRAASTTRPRASATCCASLAVTLGRPLPAGARGRARPTTVVALAGERGVTRLAMAAPRGRGRDVAAARRPAHHAAGRARGRGLPAARRPAPRGARSETDEPPPRPGGDRPELPAGRARRTRCARGPRRARWCWRRWSWCPTPSPWTRASTGPWPTPAPCSTRASGPARGAAVFDTRLLRARSFAEGVLDALDGRALRRAGAEDRPASPRNGMRAQVETLLERAEPDGRAGARRAPAAAYCLRQAARV